MKLFNLYFSAALFIVLSLLLTTDVHAQWTVEYRQLAAQNNRTQAYFNKIVLPGDSDSTVTLASVFSLPYNYLPFKKYKGTTTDKSFYSTAEISMEVFRSNKSNLREENVSVKGLEPVARAFWSDTAFVKDYEDSKSQHQYLEGYLKTTVEPGIYSYILQMRRGETTKDQTSRTRTVRVNSFSEMETGNVILGRKVVENQQPTQLVLSSLGKNVEYSKDVYSLIYLPDYQTDENYTLEITNLEVDDQDTTEVTTVYTKELTPSDIQTNTIPSLAPKNASGTRINLTSSEKGYTYALTKIPNSKFPNAIYRISVTKEGEDKAIAKSSFRSVWVDIPNSLLSLDVAINMLDYIVDEETIDRLSTGTQREREKKFRQFWKKKDPTPKTQYNELMAEYYERIDYAYENFTTENSLGYKSDRGEVYIKFGPPNDINRKFPTNGPTQEIWTYKNRKFVFRATTGFGDFKLISEDAR